MNQHYKPLNYGYLTKNGYLKESEFDCISDNFNECNTNPRMKMVFIGQCEEKANDDQDSGPKVLKVPNGVVRAIYTTGMVYEGNMT